MELCKEKRACGKLSCFSLNTIKLDVKGEAEVKGINSLVFYKAVARLDQLAKSIFHFTSDSPFWLFLLFYSSSFFLRKKKNKVKSILFLNMNKTLLIFSDNKTAGSMITGLLFVFQCV